MLADSVLKNHPEVDDEALTEVLSSKLCRWTEYQNIIRAVRAATAALRPTKGW